MKKIAVDDFRTTNAAQRMVLDGVHLNDYFARHIGRAYLAANNEQEAVLRSAFGELFGKYGASVVRKTDSAPDDFQAVTDALAHTKGELDKALASRQELLKALQTAIELMEQEDFGTLSLVPKLRDAIGRAGVNVV